MEKVSFVVIARNSENTIDLCLKSIQCLPYTEKEIIVVDDDSQDLTREISDKYTDKIIHKEPKDLGISNSRNAGIALSTGKYIFVIDSDIEILKLDIDSIISLFKKNNKLIALSGNYATDENKRIQHDFNFFLDIRRQKIFQKYKRSFIYNKKNYTTFSGGFSCINKELMNEIPLFINNNNTNSEDLIWQLQLINKGYNFAYETDFIGRHHHSRKFENALKKCYLEVNGDTWLTFLALSAKSFPAALEDVLYFPIFLPLCILFIFINMYVALILIILELLPYLYCIVSKENMSFMERMTFLAYFMLKKILLIYFVLKQLVLGPASLKVRLKFIIFSIYSDFLAKINWIYRVLQH